MKIYRNIEEFEKLNYAVVTSGTFDGVHVGHQKILNKLVDTAHNDNGESVVITFWPHPRYVLYPNHGDHLKLLHTFEEKAQRIEKLGIDHLVCIPFTLEFSQLTSQAFIRNILIDKIGTKKLVIGHDHRFGKNREGSFEHLRANAHTYGFEVEEIPRQDIEHVGVSSTLIRNNLEEGKVEISAQYLGHEYSMSGKVVKGSEIGRTISFPTANIEIDEPNKLVPSDGAYAVRVNVVGQSLNGMLNIGYRPTVDGSKHTIEVHIFDFENDLYDETISISFVKLLRKEKKFENVEALKQQLEQDKLLAIELLNS